MTDLIVFHLKFETVVVLNHRVIQTYAQQKRISEQEALDKLKRIILTNQVLCEIDKLGRQP